jgi:mono/diheme cytochrome c family protein
MRSTKITLLAISTIIIAACSTSKKSTTSTASSSPAQAPAAASAKPLNGVFEPGNEELTAIQRQYKEVTLARLKEGHNLYTEGACIGCHGAKNIYKRGEAQWKDIIDDMAQKAQITDAQKDAVYKYVLAIKATQPKEVK